MIKLEVGNFVLDIEDLNDLEPGKVTLTDTSIGQVWAGLLLPEGNRDGLYMVLNDGETYSGLAGCKIVQVLDAPDPDDVDNIVKYPEEYPDVTVETRLEY
jgi:hypothetical protein